MAGTGEGSIRGSGNSQEQAEVALPAAASGAGLGTVSTHSGETRASGHGHGHSPAQQLMEALRKSQEEIAGMGVAEVLAYQERLRALRLRVLQRIKEEQEKVAAAEQATATAPEPRRAG